MNNDFKNKMIELARMINDELTEDQVENFFKYMNLLLEWNEKINLTAITDVDDIILKHFIDSMTVLKYIEKDKSIIDVGTGAGFPGIPIAIMRENVKITLLDSLNKRINFLSDVIRELKLTDIETIHARIEDYAHNNKDKFDIVTARAVAPLNILLEYAIPITKVNSYFVAMKGKTEDATTYNNALKVLNSEIKEIKEFKLPIENSDRTIYKIIKISKSNGKYPRKPSEIKKNVL